MRAGGPLAAERTVNGLAILLGGYPVFFGLLLAGDRLLGWPLLRALAEPND